MTVQRATSMETSEYSGFVGFWVYVAFIFICGASALVLWWVGMRSR